MQQLRAAVKELQGDVTAFEAGVSTPVQKARGQMESLVRGVVDGIASIRVEKVEPVLSGLSSRIQALEAELAELEP